MEELHDEEKEIKRPLTLTVLCILTFAFSALGCLSSIFTTLYADDVIAYLKKDPGFNEMLMANQLKLLNAGWGYYMLTLLFTLGSLTGALLMWKLKKNGFHFYAFSNLALLFLPILLIGLAIGWSAIFFTLFFIVLYATHLKYMK